MLRIAVCDDNAAFLEQMRRLLEAWPKLPKQHVIDYFEEGSTLIEAHAKAPYHILLLDIIMPVFNGMDAAREIRLMDQAAKLVFLTSSSDYAVDSYTVKASNYLLKPVDSEALYACLDELEAEFKHQGPSVAVRGANAAYQVKLDELEYVEAQNKQLCFVLSNGHAIHAVDPLYTYEDKLLLKDGFIKCHRSYIVNLQHIATYTQKEVQMRSGCRIPISRGCHKAFEEAFFNAIFDKAGGLK